jgi:hypothetical protein
VEELQVIKPGTYVLIGDVGVLMLAKVLSVRVRECNYIEYECEWNDQDKGESRTVEWIPASSVSVHEKQGEEGKAAMRWKWHPLSQPYPQA